MPKEAHPLTAHIYPSADHTTQWFGGTYPGDTMAHPNVIVLHTTEGSSFPSYSGGSEAPNFTVKGGTVRQHFYANHSARALVNSAGGVETNTLNVVQIEMVGTCDKGGPGLYWPTAKDADMKALASLVKWLTDTYPIPVASTSKPWLAYPSSYGSAGGQRMSFAQWNDFSGICGHQHVPENYHGDPGNFPIKRLIELVKGAKPAAGGSSSAPSSWDGKSFPGASAFVLGKSHPAVTVLGQRLIAHGYSSFYKVGPGPTFGQADKDATQGFQKAQGWSGADADGYPGAETWSRLMAAPKAKAAAKVVDLSNLLSAAKADPKATQGHTTHAADVKLVEAALKTEGFLSSKYASDGSFGTTTVSAYRKWQLKLYPGASTKPGGDADGMPGMDSLKKLGAKHGFTVKA